MSFFKCNFHSFKFEDTSFHWLGYSNIYEHSLRSSNCTFTFRHAGHSRLRARFQLNLPSMESFIKRSSLGSWSQPLVTLMSCTGFADHQPGSDDNDWTEFMAERVDLTIWGVCLVTHQWLWLRSHTEPWTNIKVASAHEGSAAPSVSEIWCICLRSWLPAQIDRGRCFLASFFFVKMTKWCLEGEAEQVRHRFCTTAPSSPASLPICPLALLSAFNESSFPDCLFCILYFAICLFV